MNSSSNSENYSIDRTSIEEEIPNYANSIEYSGIEKIELEARRKYYFHRWIWSWSILFWITIILIFDCYLAHKVGVSEWNFDKYPWLIHEIVGVNFLQLIGMGFVIVKFLFNPFLQYINQSKAEFLPDNN